MAEKPGEIAGIYVQGSGTGRSIVAGAVGGAAGTLLAGGGKAESPLGVRQLGYVSVSPDQVTIFGSKRKALTGGFKPTDDIITAVPRSSIAGATFTKGKIVGDLQIAFHDGNVWVFEVPRVGNKTVDEAVAAMSQT